MGEREQLELAIAAQEGLRGVVGDDVVDAAIAALRDRLVALAGGASGEKRRKQVTVLFADVSGFTSASEEMDAEEVADSVNVLWQRLDAAITDFNGRIDKHIGDAVMGLWGADEAREDDPEQAIRAALAMLAAVEELTAAGQARFPIRIGINTGPVVLGEVGTTGEYTAMGNTVNVAARIQAAAPVGGILVNHDTYRHVRGVFSVELQEPLAVKGMSEPLRTYTVAAVRPRAFRLEARGVEGVETRMIGREADLRRLQEALGTAIGEQRLQFVEVIGDAGIGKSRLLYEFEDWLRVQPTEVRMFKGRADHQHQGVPYGLARDVFYFRFETADDDPPDVVLGKLEEGVAGFMGDDSREQAHLIGHLIGLDLSGTELLGGIIDDAKQLHDRALQSITRLFLAVTAQTPAVVLLEDIHWADQASLQLVRHIVETCRQAPMLIVALMRPSLFERLPGWDDELPGLIRVSLSPLSDAESGQLFDEVLQRVPFIPEQIRDQIVANVDGNPFYVEEVIKMMIEDGVVVTGDDVWHLEPIRLGDLHVPATLTGVLQARLDRLEPLERDTLGRASVVGRIFWDAAIPPRDMDEPRSAEPALKGELPEVLDALQRKELIRPHNTPDFADTDEYIFNHSILREVTYEGVLKSRRPAYHGWVARWLAGRPEVMAYPAMIARHYELADLPDEAARWYGEAARGAQARYANDEAVEYYRLALQPESLDRATRVALNRGLGEVLMLQARYDEALPAMEAMMEQARVGDDIAGQAQALNAISAMYTRLGRGREALQTAEEAEQLLRGSAEPHTVELANVLNRIGGAHLRLGQMEAARRYGEEALALAAGVDHATGMRAALSLLGAHNNGIGQHSGAAVYFERGLELSREVGDRFGEGRALLNLGEVARLQGDFATAATRSRQALAIQRELGDRDQLALTMSNLGAAYVGMGEYAEAVAQLGEAGGEFSAAGASEHISETCRLLAEAYLGLGEIDEALLHAKQALSVAATEENPEHIGHAWRVLGRLAAAQRGAVEVEWGGATARWDAAACFQKAVATFAEAGMEAFEALALWDWAAVDLRHGGTEAAESMWHEAREKFSRLDLPVFVARMDSAHLFAEDDSAPHAPSTEGSAIGNKAPGT